MSEYYDSVVALAKYLGVTSHVGFDDILIEPVTITDASGATIAGDGGADNAIAEMAANLGPLEILREALYGKSPGTPLIEEIVTMLDSSGDSLKIGENTFIAIQSNAEGDLDGTQFPGGWMLAGSPYISMVAPAEPDDPRTPVYNIMTVDGTFSREVGSPSALSMFLNMIPTIELSRAVPYLDVQFMGQINTADPSPPVGTSQGLPNLYRFLVGEGLSSGPYAGWGGVSSGLQLIDGSEDTSEAAEKTNLKQASGMEVFMSPQTLVNANERDGSAKRLGGFKNKTAGVLDPFRPFMSLNSLSLEIAPQVNSIIFSQGTISFTLHDRSRIGEISALVNPRNMGNTYMRIEYGWSHPDGQPGQSEEGGAFGKFLNSLKTTETFQIANSSYTFTPTGEVQISCPIFASGAGAASRNARILDDVVASEMALIQRVENAILTIQDSLPEPQVGQPPIIRPKSLFENAAKGSGVYGIDMAAQARSIALFINSIRAAGTSINQDITTAWTDAFGDDGDMLANLEAAKTKITSALAAKITKLSTTPDPWLDIEFISSDNTPPGLFTAMDNSQLTDPDLNKSTYSTHGPGKLYTSLAKLVSIFITEPMINSSSSTSDFDECQVLFGCLNSRASYASSQNLACMPIKISTLETGLNAIAENTGPNITVGSFIAFINNYFFDNEGWEPYGFGRTGRGYTRTINSDTGLYDYKAIESEVGQSSAYNRKQVVLADAYGPGEHLEFKQPLIKYFIEAPDNNVITPEFSESGENANRAKKILRIYIEDEKANSFDGAADLMSRVFADYIPGRIAENRGTGAKDVASTAHAWSRIDMDRTYTLADSLGLVEETTGGTVKFKGGSAWKDLMKSMAPGIDLGSMHTAVMGASISSQESGELRDVHMLAGTAGNAEHPGQAFVPLTMMPQSITLDLIGCPLIAPMQTYFVDFRTGTDLDALYSVNSVSHEISPGKFKTTANLLYTGGYATFQPMARRLGNLAAHLADQGLDVSVTDPAGIDSAIDSAAGDAVNATRDEMLPALTVADVMPADANIALLRGATLNDNASAHAEARAARNAYFKTVTINKIIRDMRSALSLIVQYNIRINAGTSTDLHESALAVKSEQFVALGTQLKSWVDNYASGPEDNQAQKAEAVLFLASMAAHADAPKL